jgi:hypothetical protein
MANIKRRTFMMFDNKAAREEAIDFLLKMNIKFTGNVSSANGFYWLSIAPRVFYKNCLDLYIGNWVNVFSKIYKK